MIAVTPEDRAGFDALVARMELREIMASDPTVIGLEAAFVAARLQPTEPYRALDVATAAQSHLPNSATTSS